jgi:hypothetical protein
MMMIQVSLALLMEMEYVMLVAGVSFSYSCKDWVIL